MPVTESEITRILQGWSVGDTVLRSVAEGKRVLKGALTERSVLLILDDPQPRDPHRSRSR